METKHTPGPWKVIQQDYKVYADDKEYTLTEYRVATEQIHPQLQREDEVISQWVSVDKDKKRQVHIKLNEADAKLIAAAPEMLSALEGLVKLLGIQKWKEMQAAKEAINKATT